MIYLIQLLAPPNGLAYLIDAPDVEYRTLEGVLMDATAHYVVEVPAAVIPDWYTGPDPMIELQEAPRLITKLSCRMRFTMTEKATLELAALDDPSADMAARQLSAVLRSSLRDLDAAQFVDLKFPDTRDGVMMLEQAGLIGVGRALEILDAEIQPIERA